MISSLILKYKASIAIAIPIRNIIPNTISKMLLYLPFQTPHTNKITMTVINIILLSIYRFISSELPPISGVLSSISLYSFFTDLLYLFMSISIIPVSIP